VNTVMTFGLHKMRGISGLAENRLPFQEDFSPWSKYVSRYRYISPFLQATSALRKSRDVALLF
jgi:hypothetical protein